MASVLLTGVAHPGEAEGKVLGVVRPAKGGCGAGEAAPLRVHMGQ